MKEHSNKIHRRTFLRGALLKRGGGGLGVLGGGPLEFSWAEGADLPTRNKPEKPVVLKSSDLEVTLDPKDGLPYAYKLLRSNAQFRGEDYGAQIKVTVCDRGQWKFSPVPVTVSTVKATRNQADFHFEASQDGKPSVSFTVRYHLHGSMLTVTMEDVQEQEDFELIEVALPRLATVREEDGAAWLAHGENGGNLAILNEAKAGSLPPNRFWGNVLASLPVVLIGTAPAVWLQEVTEFTDWPPLEAAVA